MRCPILIWEPKEVCCLLCRYDKNIFDSENISPLGLEIIMIKSGQLLAESGSDVICASVGDMVFYGSVVNLVPISESCCFSVCGLGGDAALKAAEAAGCLCARAPCEKPTALFEHIFSQGEAASPVECFALINSLFEAAENSERDIPPLAAEAVLQMRRNYSRIYGVEELSENLGVSKSHLIRVFTAAMGKPPGEYLTEIRLNAAKQLLSGSEHSLEIIAGLCGFSGANYFCRVFKQKTGYTPAQYRRLFSASERESIFRENEMYV